MGLPARRTIEKFKSKDLVEISQKIEKMIGKPIAIEVEWNQFEVQIDNWSGDTYSDLQRFFEWIYMKPLIAAIENVAVDEMGKQALQQGLDKIIILSSGNVYNGDKNTFENKILTIDDRYSNEEFELRRRTSNIQSLWEKSL